jgi:tRNA-Thr(GGU) m(6)t(6)A37 methyltransferase TsaA
MLTYKIIGVIHSSFKEPKTFHTSGCLKGTKGTVEVDHSTRRLKDLEGFSHVTLIYHLNLVKGYSLTVKPFLDDNVHGIFATRSPARPNPIGISTVRLTRIENNTLHIQEVDIVDGTPLLDIKPYVPKFDNRRATKIGWFTQK